MSPDVLYFLPRHKKKKNAGGDPKIDFTIHHLENTSPLDLKKKLF